MNKEKQETVADIVAEMRTDYSSIECVGAKIIRYADRIEAASKRYCFDCLGYHIYHDGLRKLREENFRRLDARRDKSRL